MFSTENVRKTLSFSDRLMFAGRKGFLISIPEITVSTTVFVGFWEAVPQLTTTGFTAITDKESHNLTGAPTPSSLSLLWSQN